MKNDYAKITTNIHTYIVAYSSNIMTCKLTPHDFNLPQFNNNLPLCIKVYFADSSRIRLHWKIITMSYPEFSLL